MFYKIEDAFTLLPHCISLSSLSFDFSSLLLSLWSMKEPGIHTPITCFFWSASLNPRDGGAWWAAIYEATQSQTRRSNLAAAAAVCHLLGLLAPWLKFLPCLNTLSLGLIGLSCSEQRNLGHGHSFFDILFLNNYFSFVLKKDFRHLIIVTNYV